MVLPTSRDSHWPHRKMKAMLCPVTSLTDTLSRCQLVLRPALSCPMISFSSAPSRGSCTWNVSLAPRLNESMVEASLTWPLWPSVPYREMKTPQSVPPLSTLLVYTWGVGAGRGEERRAGGGGK